MLAVSNSADGPSPKSHFLAATIVIRRVAAGLTALPALVWGGSGRTAGTDRTRVMGAFVRGVAVFGGREV